MKRIFIFTLLLFAAIAVSAKDIKYVFYMIGDGMGVNQVFSAERYLGSMDGSFGRQGLVMTTFPNVGLSHTYSTSDGITDSAAGGTALSCGEKTSNHTIGMNSDHTAALETIAEKAKKAGKAVGIITSVSIDHATPAVFYAHQADRNSYYEIGKELAASNFDFFGGAWFKQPAGPKGKDENLADIVAKAGYTTITGYDQYKAEGRKHDKVILTQENKKATGIPYAIDSKDSDLKLAQITSAAVDFLEAKSGNKGFFLMVEGGQIDWACHANDAAASMTEVVDFDKSIAIAYEFYKKHPDETIIVITADHETGGLALGNSDYTLHFDRLAQQKCSQGALSAMFVKAINEKKAEFTIADMKKILSDELGFYTTVKVSKDMEKELLNAYVKTMSSKNATVKSEYFTDEIIAVTAVRMLDKSSRVGWTSTQHTSGAVPVFSIGKGTERLRGVMENCEIPQRMLEIVKY